MPELIFSLLTIGVLYFWKAGDTRISEIKFAGTTGPTGTSGNRYIRYPRYLKTPNAWFYDKRDVNEATYDNRSYWIWQTKPSSRYM